MQKYTRKTCAARKATPAPTIVSKINAMKKNIMMRAPSPASGTRHQRPASPAIEHHQTSPGTSIPSDAVRGARSRSHAAHPKDRPS